MLRKSSIGRSRKFTSEKKPDLLSFSSDEERHANTNFPTSSMYHWDIVSSPDSDSDDDSSEHWMVDSSSDSDGEKGRNRIDDLNFMTWPPVTHSSTNAVFSITPHMHKKLDPKLRETTRSKRLRGHEPSKLQKYVQEHTSFEKIYDQELDIIVKRRMDAFSSAWDLCNHKIEKMISRSFNDCISQVCSFVKSTELETNAQSGIIPTAIVLMGPNTADHSLVYDQLGCSLRSSSRLTTFLSPEICTKFSKLVKELLLQLVPSNKIEERSIESLAEYMASLHSKPSICFIFEDMEQWNFEVIHCLILNILRYLEPFRPSFIFAACSSQVAAKHALPPSIQSLISSRFFSLDNSIDIIDKMVKLLFVTPETPLRISAEVLEWILQKFRYMDSSFNSAVAVFKFIYWKFFYTVPLSWLTDISNLKSLSYMHQPEALHPIEHFLWKHKLEDLASTMYSYNPPTVQSITLVTNQLKSWALMYNRLQVVRAVGFELFIKARNCIDSPSQYAISTNLLRLHTHPKAFIDATFDSLQSFASVHQVLSSWMDVLKQHTGSTVYEPLCALYRNLYEERLEWLGQCISSQSAEDGSAHYELERLKVSMKDLMLVSFEDHPNNPLIMEFTYSDAASLQKHFNPNTLSRLSKVSTQFANQLNVLH